MDVFAAAAKNTFLTSLVVVCHAESEDFETWASKAKEILSCNYTLLDVSFRKLRFLHKQELFDALQNRNRYLKAQRDEAAKVKMATELNSPQEN